MPNPAPLRQIVRRRSHYLVYDYMNRDAAGWRAIEQQVTVLEKVGKGHWEPVLTAALKDVDPAGRPVLRLPGGLPAKLLQDAFPGHEVRVSASAWPVRETRVGFLSAKYPYRNRPQARIVELLTRTGEFADRPDRGTELIVAGTSSGKSYASIRAWTEIGGPLVAVFAFAVHLENFRQELLKFTDLTEAEIFVADDGQHSMTKAMLERPDGFKVALVLHRSISRGIAEVVENGRLRRAPKVTEFVQWFGTSVLIIDEAHKELLSLLMMGLLLNVLLTVYLTATPRRTEWREDRTLAAQLPRDRALYLKQAKRLQVQQLRIDTKPAPEDVLGCINKIGYFDVNAYFEYLQRPAMFERWFEYVSGLVQQAFDDGATSVGVVVAGRLEFLDQVYGELRKAFPERTVGNFSSATKKVAERMQHLDRDIVVTTEKSFGGSVNPTRMDYLILLAPVGSPVVQEQIAGRLRGESGLDCMLWDVWDAGFPKLQDQAKKRAHTWKKLVKDLLVEVA
jgi:hypothetical protein